ncbi:MAG: hypothetical protein MI975_26425 [Cytophagales bacterium]|nr:hypothetical protein [Cytophagales bacterium]
MKFLTLIISLLMAGLNVQAQTATEYFNKAANEYIYVNDQMALNTIDRGLNQYPDDVPLTKLKEKIEKEQQNQEQQQQQNQQQEQQEQQEQQNQEQQNEQNQEQQEDQQQNQEQEQQQPEEGEESEQKDQSEQAQQQETEEEGQEMEQPPQSRSEKLEELNLTEEKARMILEAMKNNEIQYIQQNRRKPRKKSDSNKPDW